MTAELDPYSGHDVLSCLMKQMGHLETCTRLQARRSIGPLRLVADMALPTLLLRLRHQLPDGPMTLNGAWSTKRTYGSGPVHWDLAKL